MILVDLWITLSKTAHVHFFHFIRKKLRHRAVKERLLASRWKNVGLDAEGERGGAGNKAGLSAHETQPPKTAQSGWRKEEVGRGREMPWDFLLINAFPILVALHFSVTYPFTLDL